MDALETPRLLLEPLDPDHADALFEGLRDESLYEFISERPPQSLSALRDRYTRLATRKSPDLTEDWLNWALWSKPHGRFVGYVQATVHGDGTASVAYVLLRDYWGMGLARESVSAMMDHLGDAYGVRRLIASVDPANHRSHALVEALGFVRVPTNPYAAEAANEASESVEYELVLA